MTLPHTGPIHRVLAAAAAGATVLAAVAVSTSSTPVAAQTPPGSCQLGNGIQHVIHITFDNVHFYRDNPNVPSDVEQMPTLRNFIEGNGTLLSNQHTPLIAHTANDSLTEYSGLRRSSRHGNFQQLRVLQWSDRPIGRFVRLLAEPNHRPRHSDSERH